MTSRATASHASPCRLPLSGALAVALLCGAGPASADPAVEREQLAAAMRLLDQVDRIAQASDATVTPPQPARYHFDFIRLRDDVRHMRAGLAGYLAPRRAQPRDPVPLTGDYTRESSSPSTQRERSR